MLRRAGRRLALTALCLSFAGCATVYSFPKAMGGVRTHGEMLGIGQSGNFYRGIGQALWVIFLPISLSDLALSLGADIAPQSRSSASRGSSRRSSVTSIM